MKRDADKQQQITSLWPERVKRTRSTSIEGPGRCSSSTPSKRAKLHDQDRPSSPPTAPPAPTVLPIKRRKSSEPTHASISKHSQSKSSDEDSGPTSSSSPSKRAKLHDQDRPSSPTPTPAPTVLPAKRKKVSEPTHASTSKSTTTPKRQKVVTFAPTVTVAATPSASHSAPPVSKKESALQSQKKKWRLAEVVKKEREAKRLRSATKEPSFVFVPISTESDPKASSSSTSPNQHSHPNPDSSNPASKPSSTPQSDLNRTKPLPSSSSSNEASLASTAVTTSISSLQSPPIAPSSAKPPRFHPPSSTSMRHVVRTASVPGSDALLHDQSMLPSSYVLLIDVLSSMEVALNLLRTRQTPSSVAAVRDIVQRDSKRDFTLRTLGQLAAVVPECVAVSEPRVRPQRSGNGKQKLSDSLLIRLDDPEGRRTQLSVGGREGLLTITSELGDGPARIRRAFLHRRLLQIVREHHDRFIKARSSDDENRNAVWHPDFDPEKDVPALPAPPLISDSSRTTSRSVSELLPSDGSILDRVARRAKSETDKTIANETTGSSVSALASSSSSLSSSGRKQPIGLEKPKTTKDDDDDDDDDDDGDELSGISKNLLARVRARSKAKEQRAEKADQERSSNRSLLSKLPCTMDSINTVLRTERRSAMGWKQLVQKVATVHPRKHPKEDIELQMDAIAKIATSWCSKVELKSSRGGFAFRVVSDKAFAEARNKVSSTESLSMD